MQDTQVACGDVVLFSGSWSNAPKNHKILKTKSTCVKPSGHKGHTHIDEDGNKRSGWFCPQCTCHCDWAMPQCVGCGYSKDG